MRTAENVTKRIGNIRDASNSVIISDEGLWHFMGTSRVDIHAFASALADYDTTVIVNFRRPEEFLES